MAASTPFHPVLLSAFLARSWIKKKKDDDLQCMDHCALRTSGNPMSLRVLIVSSTVGILQTSKKETFLDSSVLFEELQRICGFQFSVSTSLSKAQSSHTGFNNVI